MHGSQSMNKIFEDIGVTTGYMSQIQQKLYNNIYNAIEKNDFRSYKKWLKWLKLFNIYNKSQNK